MKVFEIVCFLVLLAMVLLVSYLVVSPSLPESMQPGTNCPCREEGEEECDCKPGTCKCEECICRKDRRCKYFPEKESKSTCHIPDD